MDALRGLKMRFHLTTKQIYRNDSVETPLLLLGQVRQERRLHEWASHSVKLEEGISTSRGSTKILSANTVRLPVTGS